MPVACILCLLVFIIFFVVGLLLWYILGFGCGFDWLRLACLGWWIWRFSGELLGGIWMRVSGFGVVVLVYFAFLRSDSCG